MYMYIYSTHTIIYSHESVWLLWLLWSFWLCIMIMIGITVLFREGLPCVTYICIYNSTWTWDFDESRKKQKQHIHVEYTPRPSPACPASHARPTTAKGRWTVDKNPFEEGLLSLHWGTQTQKTCMGIPKKPGKVTLCEYKSTWPFKQISARRMCR